MKSLVHWAPPVLRTRLQIKLVSTAAGCLCTDLLILAVKNLDAESTRKVLNSAPQNYLGSKILFLKCFPPLSSAVLPSGEGIWYLLLFLEFHLLESWEYCRPQLSVHKIYISSTDRWRKTRKPLWICKKQIETSPCIAGVFLNCQSKHFSNLSHGFSAMGSHLWLLLKISAKGERDINMLWSPGFHHTDKFKEYKVKLQCQESTLHQALLRVSQW